MRSDGAIRSFLLVFAAMVTSANGPAVGQGAAAGDNPAIYRGADREQRLLDGARKEGQVTVYSSMIADQALRPILNGFQAKYPFVKAQYVRDDPPQQLQKVMAEARAGRMVVDVLESTGLEVPVRAAGINQPFWSPESEAYPTDHRDSEGYWAPTRFSYLGACYNTNLVKPGEIKSFADFLDGNPTGFSFQYGGDSNRNTFENSHAIYLQDSYRMTPRFTLNLGLRYDYFGLIQEKHGGFSNIDPATGDTIAVGQGRLYQPDYNNVSPRVSFAWDVTGHQKTPPPRWSVISRIFAPSATSPYFFPACSACSLATKSPPAVPPFSLTSRSPSCTPFVPSSANTKPRLARINLIRFLGLGECLVVALPVSRTFTTLVPFTPNNTPTICAKKRKNPWPETVSNRTIILTASIPNPKRNPAKNRLSLRKRLFWPLIAFAHEQSTQNPRSHRAAAFCQRCRPLFASCYLLAFGCRLPAYGLRLSAAGCQFSTAFPPLWITNCEINKNALDIQRN